MRSSAFVVLCASLLVLPGLSSAAVRDDPPPTTSTTTTTVATTTAPTTTTVASPQVLPPGIKVGGVAVGGMTPAAAFLVVQDALPKTISLTVGRTPLVATRVQLGVTDYIWNAILKAKTSPAGVNVPVTTAVKGAAVRAYLAKLAARFDRAPVDAQLRLRGTAPVVTRSASGFRLQTGPAAAAVVTALKAHAEGPLALPTKAIEPSVTQKSIGAVIVIRRASNQLTLYKGMKTWKQFSVATGQKIYPTPLGKFQIVAMWKNPWWYPPNSPWAAGEKPVPPGPGNPLGTRWMGISSPGVGIHGTPDSASLGYSASHGCVRMAIPQAEWLFDHVAVGTPVYIVAS